MFNHYFFLYVILVKTIIVKEITYKVFVISHFIRLLLQYELKCLQHISTGKGEFQ